MASVRKREWDAPDGTKKSAWVVAYTDQSGKRRLKTFDKKRDADAHRQKVESELLREDHIAERESATVAQIADAFLKHQEIRKRDGAIGHGRYMQVQIAIDKHILPHLGTKLFSNLTFNDIERWFEAMAKAGGLCLTTRNHKREVLRQMEVFAVQRGYAKRRPVSDYKPPRGDGSRSVIRTFKLDEVRALLTEIETRRHGYTDRGQLMLRCAVYLAAFCGLRRGEIFGLKRESIDFAASVLRVRNSLTAYGEVKGPKTKSGIRDIPMPAQVVDALWSWDQSYFFDNPDGLFFTSRTGNRSAMTSSVHNMWRSLQVRCGLVAKGNSGEGYHFHALRHFAASWFMECGYSPADTAMLMGHKTYDLTLQVYAHGVHGPAVRHDMMHHAAAALIGAPLKTVGATQSQHRALSV